MACQEYLQPGSSGLSELTEQFPTEMTFRLEGCETDDGAAAAWLWLVKAEPNPFPYGVVVGDHGGYVGYKVPSKLGNLLTDNSYEDDGFRFHDAMHISFATTFGSSAVLRSLMRIKRKSLPLVDEVEDGGRAIAIEEGLVAHIGRLTLVDGFDAEQVIGDPGVKSLIRTFDRGIGPIVPQHKWELAIRQGMSAMYDLIDYNGGYLHADLNAGKLTYSEDGQY